MTTPTPPARREAQRLTNDAKREMRLDRVAQLDRERYSNEMALAEAKVRSAGTEEEIASKAAEVSRLEKNIADLDAMIAVHDVK